MIRAIVAALAIVGCFVPETRALGAGEHELRFSNGDDVSTLNPVVSAETTVGLLSQLTMAYLVRYDARNAPVAELATVVPTRQNGGISSDGKTITWHLRPGVRWSDGVAFDASDVAFTVGAIKDGANTVASRDGFEIVQSVETPDARTAIFRLSRPYAEFIPRYFGNAPGNPCILPRHAFSAPGDLSKAANNALPIGIGPFRYTRWLRGDRIEMERNPFYFRKRPKLERVTFVISADAAKADLRLRTHDVDLVTKADPIALERARSDASLQTLVTSSYRFVTLAFNTSAFPTNDLEVRSALRMAVDRHAILTKANLGLGVLAESFVPPQYAGSRRMVFHDYDPDVARRKLDAAGWVAGSDGVRTKDGKRLHIDIIAVNGAYASTLELLRAAWSAIGVEVQTKTYDPKAYYAQPDGPAFGGHFSAALYSIANFPKVDPNLILGCDRVPPGGLNLSRFCRADVDAAIARYDGALDAPVQARYLRDVADLVDRYIPFVVLSYTENAFIFDRHLRGFSPNAITYFDEMLDVDR